MCLTLICAGNCMRQQNFYMLDAMRGRNLFYSYTSYTNVCTTLFINFEWKSPEKMCAVHLYVPYVHVPCEFATLHPPHDLRFTLVFHIHCVPTIATTINFFFFFFFCFATFSSRSFTLCIVMFTFILTLTQTIII